MRKAEDRGYLVVSARCHGVRRRVSAVAIVTGGEFSHCRPIGKGVRARLDSDLQFGTWGLNTAQSKTPSWGQLVRQSSGSMDTQMVSAQEAVRGVRAHLEISPALAYALAGRILGRDKKRNGGLSCPARVPWP